MAVEGVLKLAGEFVANFYHLIVSDQFADVIHLYKEDAVVTRGTEGAKASSPKVRSCEIFEALFAIMCVPCG